MKRSIKLFATALLSTVMLFSGTVLAAETEATAGETEESTVLETIEETTAETAAETETTTAADVTVETDKDGRPMINGQTFDTMYGSQLPVYLNHQYYYDTNPIPLAESNFYFIHIFSIMSQDALNGDYPITGENFVDLAYPLPNGELDQMSYSILGDVFKEWSDAQIQSTYIVLDLAKENNIELTAEELAGVDDYMAELDNMAKSLGLDTESYLKLFYGDDCTPEVFRGIIERYQLSTKFSDEYYKICEFSEDEIMAPHVCHALFIDRKDTNEDGEEVVKTGKEIAEEFLATCTSPQDILTYGKRLVSSNDKACRECADYFVTKDSSFVEEFEKWAVDPERQVGDMDIVQTQYGYHVMGFLGVEEVSDNVKQNLAMAALNDEVGAIAMSNVHSFYTNDKFGTPPEIKGDTVPEETEETTNPSLPLDEEGNIVIETTETTRPSEYITSSPIDPGKEILFGRYTSLIIAGAIILVIIVIVVFIVLKNRKNHTALIEDEEEEKEVSKAEVKTEAEPAEEETEEGTDGEV